ncbi:uncharacterized membrane protein YhaH (DUF805 family) [Allocatelliglobosispora scoriae]|uniref:Uncharacterized membrane protein YhaH (DUF805 family) n=1 Tax=Allocatelliglobosispora scoriae TaxID=643052 RepID=A0A841BRV1_9ACTN|nr:hypothetical protein [Allocatelliglobosispora scoriae]MBB5870128.1 uncharacterized membrane protein YhaH (DUF805 family) [Allocatelliglobosispora scoriae]
MRSTPLARLLAVLASAGIALGAAATPAAAHGADAPDATNYRTTMTSMSPVTPGLEVKVIEAGARLQLTSTLPAKVEVLGYEGEPYLEVRPDGVYENVNSPAVYINANLTGGVEPPANANPTSPPQWRKLSDDRVARWHDRRTHWASFTPPPAVAADPTEPHLISEWTVPLRIELATIEVKGTLAWAPPPSPVLWWALCAVVALILVPLGLVRRRVGVPAMGLILIVGGVSALAYIGARELDAGNNTFGAMVAGIWATELWPAVAGLAAIAAGIFALTRRPAAEFALALAGAGLAMFGGIVNAAVYFRSVAPVPWTDTTARLVVTAAIGIGAGIAGAASLTLRRQRPAAAEKEEASA